MLGDQSKMASCDGNISKRGKKSDDGAKSSQVTFTVIDSLSCSCVLESGHVLLKHSNLSTDSDLSKEFRLSYCVQDVDCLLHVLLKTGTSIPCH